MQVYYHLDSTNRQPTTPGQGYSRRGANGPWDVAGHIRQPWPSFEQLFWQGPGALQHSLPHRQRTCHIQLVMTSTFSSHEWHWVQRRRKQKEALHFVLQFSQLQHEWTYLHRMVSVCPPSCGMHHCQSWAGQHYNWMINTNKHMATHSKIVHLGAGPSPHNTLWIHPVPSLHIAARVRIQNRRQNMIWRVLAVPAVPWLRWWWLRCIVLHSQAPRDLLTRHNQQQWGTGSPIEQEIGQNPSLLHFPTHNFCWRSMVTMHCE